MMLKNIGRYETINREYEIKTIEPPLDYHGQQNDSFSETEIANDFGKNLASKIVNASHRSTVS